MNFWKIAIGFIAISSTYLFNHVKATEEQAEYAAKRVARALEIEYGITVGSYYWHGALYEGQSDYVSKTFYKGTQYILVAAGCNYAEDIDIEVYDEYYNLIAEDDDSDQAAAVTFTPRWTGEFHIKVTMYDASSTARVHWVLLYGY